MPGRLDQAEPALRPQGTPAFCPRHHNTPSGVVRGAGPIGTGGRGRAPCGLPHAQSISGAYNHTMPMGVSQARVPFRCCQPHGLGGHIPGDDRAFSGRLRSRRRRRTGGRSRPPHASGRAPLDIHLLACRCRLLHEWAGAISKSVELSRPASSPRSARGHGQSAARSR